MQHIKAHLRLFLFLPLFLSCCLLAHAQPAFQTLTPAESSPRESVFGQNLSLFEDNLLISNTGFSKRSEYEGAIEVYQNNAGVWERVHIIQPSQGKTHGAFGAFHFVIGNELLATDRFGVHVFQNESGGWHEKQYLVVPDSLTYEFGHRIFKSDNHVFISLFKQDVSGTHSALLAYKKSNSLWQPFQLLQPPETKPDRFGSSFCSFGDLIAVGAPRDPVVGDQSGSVYTFTLKNNRWVLDQKIIPSNPVFADQFGVSLACMDNHLLIVSRERLYNFATEEGRWFEADTLALPVNVANSRVVYVKNDTLMLHRDYPPTTFQGREVFLSYINMLRLNRGKFELIKTIKYPKPLEEWKRDDGSFGSAIVTTEKYFIASAPFQDVIENGNFFDEKGQVYVFSKEAVLVSNTEPAPLPDNSGIDFSIYPNPASHSITINYPANTYIPSKILLHDVLGRALFHKTTSTGQLTRKLDVSTLSNGAYALTLCSPQSECLTRVFIKK